jgi:cellulose synthase/poly-beta-1,6-N-acetylglucosamine synthase-like glycosyltransferase
MYTAASALFGICFLVTVYVYFGYPALLASGFLARRKAIGKQPYQSTVSIIVAAFNEERVIEQKITNLFKADYPSDQMEILIGDDGSTDRTGEIVGRFAKCGVRLIRGEVRRGKSAIQNDAVMASSGSLLVFTDADCLIESGVLRDVVDNFADATVGLVTGTAAFLNSEQTEVTRNENLYSRYERWIRQQESDRGLLAAASGSLFAIRRELWNPIPHNVGDDFVLPLQVALRGKRNILEPQAVAWTSLPAQDDSMFKVKKRIVSKDLRGLLLYGSILNPLRSGAVAVGLWSHKLLRWLIPYFLCIMFAMNLFLLHNRLFLILLIAQILFYASAVVGVTRKRKSTRFPWSVVLSFCVVNCAAMLGVFECIANRSFAQWKPVRE